MEKIIEAQGIGKSFGDTEALKNISFEVNRGEIFGFIGPDGAGKTTLFRIITTLLLPDAGRMTVMGLDCKTGYRELRRNIGYMPGRFSLYHDLTVEENLNFYATVFGTTVRKNYDLIRDVYSHIEPFRKRLAGKLSGGMKQKLALSCALIHKPGLLVLDEPTTGVDAVSRSEFWEMLNRLREENITIIASTPYMDEAMRCNRVALIQKGQILSVNPPEKIREEFSRKIFSVKSSEKYKLINALRNFPGTATAYPFGDSVHLTFRDNEQDHSLTGYLNSMGISDATISETRAGIEDRFLELMQDK
ncbi:MAG TPA: ABC transporter ATP-binding protein [Bacteroidales bacterium]|jgi:ABC-type multidrug transport system ATPase subunit|nr:ABC transporter ATP-binding protein [Bacteroidales bacterium]HOS72272.1 ABC transporter ATP-binding protein [Bacteroidales bacterium]HQH24241.1 ABC transporter ATP-binding protein [Bacteroidales bacterium]HQJ82688.1 ABC transporter ATP-binding protein [Bacteroidales bacterium]